MQESRRPSTKTLPIRLIHSIAWMDGKSFRFSGHVVFIKEMQTQRSEIQRWTLTALSFILCRHSIHFVAVGINTRWGDGAVWLVQHRPLLFEWTAQPEFHAICGAYRLDIIAFSVSCRWQINVYWCYILLPSRLWTIILFKVVCIMSKHGRPGTLNWKLVCNLALLLWAQDHMIYKYVLHCISKCRYTSLWTYGGDCGKLQPRVNLISLWPRFLTRQLVQKL